MNAPARQQKEDGRGEDASFAKRCAQIIRYAGRQPAGARRKDHLGCGNFGGGRRGLQKESDLEMIRELAALLGGDWAVSRPLVEKAGRPTRARSDYPDERSARA